MDDKKQISNLSQSHAYGRFRFVHTNIINYKK